MRQNGQCSGLVLSHLSRLRHSQLAFEEVLESLQVIYYTSIIIV